MVFAYYKRLTRNQREIYRKSDSIGVVRLPESRRFQPLVVQLAVALKQQNRVATETACRVQAAGLTNGLDVAPVRIAVLACRPHDDFWELHGLYRPAEGRRHSRIAV